jgi:hypothetical protein
MNTATGSRSVFVVLGLVMSILQASGVSAQQVRARVVDDPSRGPMEGVLVVLLGPDSTEIARTTTGPDGFFNLTAPAPGTFLIRVERLGYGSVTRSVALKEGEAVVPAFVLVQEAIPLDTLEVEASRGVVASQGVVGFSRPSYLLSGERMAELEKTGISFTSAVREIGAGLRVRGVKVGDRNYTCIESSRRTASFRGGGGSGGSCDMVAIIVDGVDTGLDGIGALQFVNYLNLHDYESVEYMTSVDAGTRYGMRASDRGALVLWTRGKGPHKSEARGGGGGREQPS